MPWFQLAYVSECCSAVSLDQEASNIYSVSKDRNAALNITGLLLFGKGHFLQFLEGEKEKVAYLFGHIAMDMRHQNITTLLAQKTENRIFKNWSMDLRQLSPDIIQEISDFLTWQKLLNTSPYGTRLPAETILNFYIRLRDGLVFRAEASNQNA